MKKYTKGKWIACTVLGSDNFSVRTEERPELIIIPVNKTDVNKSIHEELEEEAKANAKLIAAAPELLTALVTAVNYWQAHDPINFLEDIAMTEANELIKKIVE